MAQIIHIDNLDAPELLAYAHLTEAQLRHKLEPSMGVFIAESPKVIYRALEAGIRPKSLLMEEKHLIRRTSMEQDGRYKKIELEPRGVQLHEMCLTIREEVERRFTAGLTEEEAAQFKALCRKILQSME